MSEPRTTVPLAAALAIRAELVAEHGGPARWLLPAERRAALARLLALPGRESFSSAPASAAALGHALAREPLFPEGGSAFALAVTDVFLRLNGRALRAEPADAVVMFNEVARGWLAVEDFSEWLTHPHCCW